MPKRLGVTIKRPDEWYEVNFAATWSLRLGRNWKSISPQIHNGQRESRRSAKLGPHNSPALALNHSVGVNSGREKGKRTATEINEGRSGLVSTEDDDNGIYSRVWRKSPGKCGRWRTTQRL